MIDKLYKWITNAIIEAFPECNPPLPVKPAVVYYTPELIAILKQNTTFQELSKVKPLN